MPRTRSSWPRALTGSKETTTLADAPWTIADRPDDAADRETGPQRRCLVTRACQAREAMLRFVAGPDDSLVFDVTATLPGRGMWLSAERGAIDMAAKRGVFSRAAGKRLAVPERLAERVQGVLENRIVELLGLARRAGTAVGGFEKVRERLAAGRCGLLVEAADGSPAEQARLRQHHAVTMVRPLTAARLGAAFGRDSVMHVAIGPGKLAGMIAVEAARLAGVAGGSGAGGSGIGGTQVASEARSGQREADPDDRAGG